MSTLRASTPPGRTVLAGLIGLAMAASMLAGCTLPVRTDSAHPSEGECGSSMSPTDNTRLAGIEQLLREGKPHAALAQLDALEAQGPRRPQVDLVRADALRRIDRFGPAESLYRGLLSGCTQGRAWHGLGLLQAQRGQHADSLDALEKARNLQPTDVRVRNDLGYALLLAQRFEDARFEFMTVLELAPGDARAARNLVLLTLREGRVDKARELAASLGLDAATVERLAQASTTLSLAAQPLPAVATPPASIAPSAIQP